MLSAYHLLMVTFFLAILTFIFPFFIYPRLLKPLRLLKILVWGQFGLLSWTFFYLGYAFLINDFSFLYVVKNSNTHLPAIYRFCAIWGGHEGSILLWIFILQLWTLIVTLKSHQIDVGLFISVISVLSLISAGFLLFLMTLSNPFFKAPFSYIEGQDLNPLLQDPGLVFHPPLLYMGYVGLAVTFAYALAGLWRNKIDREWAKLVKPWTMAAWCFLTFGIISGSWWAYRVLGWGGWWFWDPVENASLLPWLATTALLHSLVILEKRNHLQHWVILLAILCFALSLFGTFIVRSGVLISVHSFAVDPGRGVFMLILLGLIVGLALTVYGFKINQFFKTKSLAPFISKETLLLFNNILLSVALFTVLLGTIYPIIIEALGLGKLSVGAPYFNKMFTPFAFLLLFFLGFVYQLEKNPLILNKKYFINILLMISSLFFLSMLLLKFFAYLHWKATLGLTFAFWIMLGTFQSLHSYRKKNWNWKKILHLRGAMLLAHAGVAITAIGITLSAIYSVQSDVHMTKGDQLNFAQHQFRLEKFTTLQKENFTALTASLKVDHTLIRLQPQLRYYPIAKVMLSKPAINVSLWRDYYVALSAPLMNNSWSLRFYKKPFIRWIWAGGLFMLFGGCWAILSRRHDWNKNAFI